MLDDVGLNVKINDVRHGVLSQAGRRAGPEDTSTLSYRPLVLRLPGCRRRAFPAAPFLRAAAGPPIAIPRPTRLLEAARETLDEDKRLDAYQQVHELIAKDAPLVPLYQSAIIYGAPSALQWQPTPNESMFLNRMGWKS